MPRSKRPPLDPPVVTARATQLTAAAQTQYWLVVSMTDLVALTFGVVSADLRRQAVGLRSRDRLESTEELVSRLAEIDYAALPAETESR